MSDVEDLLVRTLHDERRALTVAAGAVAAVERTSRRLQLHRRLAIGATALASVAVIAVGAMLVDGGTGSQGRLPSYQTSESARPSATPVPTAVTPRAPQPSPTPAPVTS